MPLRQPSQLVGSSAWQLFGNFFAEQAEFYAPVKMRKDPMTRAFTGGRWRI
jgi:hypothetical protein